ncbi:MAG: hypothetical protein A2293_15580 [Elusimicrobia bacterium RIFOXYB2_FULL_49_7]|nr:MAG: hypothetical protein A2293_15580 [Elusimicrobia bacterium RIFOXYB2_FULL_49_7]
MKTSTKASKTWTGICIMIAALFASLLSQTIQAYNYDVTPVVNSEATRGLSSVSSAEPVGEGRLTFNVSGNWYNQNETFVSSPNKNANIITGLGAASYGVSPYIDLFASVGAFGSSHYTNTNRSGGWGSVKAGVQGTLPYSENSMLNLGGQAALIGGTSNNQINNNRADGYNYFQTRTGNDFMAKLLQSLSFGSESHAIKLHLNEGAVTSLSGGNDPLLLLGAGLQANLLSFAALGVELNSRTQLNDWAFRTDPLWITPSVQFRTSFNTNFSAGLDVAISNDRANGEPRALEPYRLFGAVAFSFDTHAERRRAAIERKKHAAQVERENLALIKDKAVVRQQTDSLAKNTAQVEKENIALIKDQEAAGLYVDSLNRKAHADSIMLEVTTQSLNEEKAKRTDAEKMLLSTGELLLDAVYFETGKTVLTINSKPYLNIIGKMLLKYPKLQIEVAGYTDNIGDKDYNITLSQGRAEAVSFYLIEVAPALSSFLSSHGYGMSMPKADNGTKDGRQTNRRVELRVTNKDVLKEYSQL